MRETTVTANGPAVPIDQAASCWLAADAGFAFTTNAGSGSIGRYAVAPDGTLTALGSTLVENNAQSHPLDEAVSQGQQFLYVLANGLATIVGYRIGADGSLTQLTTAPVAGTSGGIAAAWVDHLGARNRPAQGEKPANPAFSGPIRPASEGQRKQRKRGRSDDQSSVRWRAP